MPCPFLARKKQSEYLHTSTILQPFFLARHKAMCLSVFILCLLKNGQITQLCLTPLEMAGRLTLGTLG